MNLLKKLFGRDPKALTTDDNFLPRRGIKLAYPALPENGEKLAALFVDAVKTNEKIILDYSPRTLEFVDSFLQRFKEEGTNVNDFAETIFVAGVYIGEIMVLHKKGIWIKQEDAALPPGVSMMPIVVRLPNGHIGDPIAKAFKRFHYGNGEDLSYFYSVFTIIKSKDNDTFNDA